MSIDQIVENKIREIVREEIASLNGQVKRFTPEQLAERWPGTTASHVRDLANAGQLKPIRISERKMVFSIEEVLRFEQAGGIVELEIAA